MYNEPTFAEQHLESDADRQEQLETETFLKEQEELQKIETKEEVFNRLLEAWIGEKCSESINQCCSDAESAQDEEYIKSREADWIKAWKDTKLSPEDERRTEAFLKALSLLRTYASIDNDNETVNNMINGLKKEWNGKEQIGRVHTDGSVTYD